MRDKLIIPLSIEDDDLLLKQFDNVKKKKESNVSIAVDKQKKCNEKKIKKNRRKRL